MRIWALASCGGFLALAACSAEQATSPTSAPPPDDGDRAQVVPQASPTPAALNPITQPEVGLRRPTADRPQVRGAALAASSASAPRPLPQANQLRQRVQRLQAQHQGPAPSKSVAKAEAIAPPATPTLPQKLTLDQSPNSFATTSPSAVVAGAGSPSALPSAVNLGFLPPLPSASLGPGPEAPVDPASWVADLGSPERVSAPQSQPIPQHHQGDSRQLSPAPVPTLRPTAPETIVASAPLWPADPALPPEAERLAATAVPPSPGVAPATVTADRVAGTPERWVATPRPQPPTPLSAHQTNLPANFSLTSRPLAPATASARSVPAAPGRVPEQALERTWEAVDVVDPAADPVGAVGLSSRPLVVPAVSGGELGAIAPGPARHQTSTLSRSITVTAGSPSAPQTLPEDLCFLLPTAQTEASHSPGPRATLSAPLDLEDVGVAIATLASCATPGPTP